MEHGEFQKLWESEAETTYKKLIELSEEELLRRIKANETDHYYQIWRALSLNGSEKSIKLLFQIVSNLKIEYLTRYHACETLFHLAGLDDKDLKGRVQYGRTLNGIEVDQAEAIRKLEELVAKTLK